jgi:hypothetical protein
MPLVLHCQCRHALYRSITTVENQTARSPQNLAQLNSVLHGNGEIAWAPTLPAFRMDQNRAPAAPIANPGVQAKRRPEREAAGGPAGGMPEAKA